MRVVIRSDEGLTLGILDSAYLFFPRRSTTLNNFYLSLSLPGVINVKFPLQPHQKYYITPYEELGFSWLYPNTQHCKGRKGAGFEKVLTRLTRIVAFWFRSRPEPDRFSCRRSSSHSPCRVVTARLCPALKAIFLHGMRKPSILGGACHPWLFIEEVGGQPCARGGECARVKAWLFFAVCVHLWICAPIACGEGWMLPLFIAVAVFMCRCTPLKKWIHSAWYCYRLKPSYVTRHKSF